MIQQLYEALYQELIRYFTGRTGSSAAAEDIVQETFLRALAHTDQLETMTLPQCRAWLYRTAKNLSVDQYRRQVPHQGSPPDTGAETDFSGVEVAQLIGRLSPQDQAIFSLRHISGYNATEIGAMLGMKPSHVRMRLKAARTILMKELN